MTSMSIRSWWWNQEALKNILISANGRRPPGNGGRPVAPAVRGNTPGLPPGCTEFWRELISM